MHVMKRMITMLVLVSAVSLVAVASTSATEPVTGSMDLEFNLGWFDYGPQDEVPDWVGTITIDGEEYGMAFFAIGSGKPFASDPNTSLHFFEEIWKIYETLDYSFDENGVLQTFVEGPIVLSGHDSGVTNLVNDKYHMTGTVEDAAEPFSDQFGRIVFMSGIIEWYPSGPPHYAPGTFRIN
jgi:hypothetical protein